MVDGIPTLTLADIHAAAGTKFERNVHRRRVLKLPSNLSDSIPASFPRRCADRVTGFRFWILVPDPCAADDTHAPECFLFHGLDDFYYGKMRCSFHCPSVFQARIKTTSGHADAATLSASFPRSRFLPLLPFTSHACNRPSQNPVMSGL